MISISMAHKICNHNSQYAAKSNTLTITFFAKKKNCNENFPKCISYIVKKVANNLVFEFCEFTNLPPLIGHHFFF